MTERLFGKTQELIGEEIKTSVDQGRGYFGQVTRVSGALAQQVGRLTDATFLQYVRDGKGGWTVVEVKSPGRITFVRKEVGSLVNNSELRRLSGIWRGIIR